MLLKLNFVVKEYPVEFRVLTLAAFIDMLGTSMLYPFFALYTTLRFNVSMLEVGMLFSIFSAGSILGGLIGGALADKYGRRKMLLLGLCMSGMGNVLIGVVNNLTFFYIFASFLGLTGNFGAPAHQAMVVDLLPNEKRTEGFGILRVAFNLSAAIGPILGGFLASRSYMLLFIADAIASLVTAIIVICVIPETKPRLKGNKSTESVLATIKGYKKVLKDGFFILFLLISSILILVYMQLNSTLSVFLRDVHGFPEQGFGLLISTNAIMVVLFQFWISRKVSKRSPMKMMALGGLFYMIGFGMYGFVSAVYLFFVAMIIITIGEMIVAPVGQTAVACIAPEDKRGRYMATFGLQWTIPNLFGVILAGLVMDHIGPNWVWYFAGILSFISILGFWLLDGMMQDRLGKRLDPPQDLGSEELLEARI
jgi:MFS family permease